MGAVSPRRFFWKSLAYLGLGLLAVLTWAHRSRMSDLFDEQDFLRSTPPNGPVETTIDLNAPASGSSAPDPARTTAFRQSQLDKPIVLSIDDLEAPDNMSAGPQKWVRVDSEESFPTPTFTTRHHHH